MTPPYLLEVDNLVKYFPIPRERGRVVHAVNGVSLKIAGGETLGLIGESGSGKTTVGRCIVRLARATSGSIRLSGEELTSLSERAMRETRAKLQMVFQDPRDSLPPRIRVKKIIEEPLVNFSPLSKNERRSRVGELLHLVQLDPSAGDKYPQQLTGGAQQRVAIARALATDPDLIVLDEPTSELDVAVRADIVRLLQTLQSKLGTAYLFISHDLTAVKEISHRIAIMYLGEIVEESATDEMFQEQFHPYSKALLTSVLFPDPERHEEVFLLEDEIPSPVDLPSGCFLHPRCPYADDRSRTEHPPLELELGRPVRCWHAAKIRVDRKRGHSDALARTKGP